MGCDETFTSTTEDSMVNEYLSDEEYREQKLLDRYGPVSSQQDAIYASARSEGMYKNSVSPMHDPSILKRVLDQPVVDVEKLAADKVGYEIDNIPNEQAMRIVLKHLPRALELYLEKSKDYGGNVMESAPGGDLGVKACFPDMWRKMGKLRLAIWEDQPLKQEPVEEVLMDMLGHIMIVLDKLSQQ